MATGPKRKRIQFFELCHADGSAIPQAVDWAGAFASVEQEPVRDRQHQIRGVVHWGQIYSYEERDHFVLARAREEGVSTFNIQQDEFIDQESEAANPYVELSVICYVPGTNRFGFLRSSNASSYAGSFAEWLNAHNVFTFPIDINPVISSYTEHKIRTAGEVKLLDIRYSPAESASRQVAGTSGLSSAMAAITDDVGPVDTEIIMRMPGQIKANEADQRGLIARLLRKVAGGAYTKALAEIVSYDDDGFAQWETLNLIEDVVSAWEFVRTSDREGNPIRIPSAVEAILKVIADKSDELGG